MMDAMTHISPTPGLYPAVLVTRGSVIKRVVWGVTTAHARRRAERWIRRMGW